MISDTLLFFSLLFLTGIPGVVCDYNGGIGGLVAASVVGFFLLMIIIGMILVLTMWQEWYERRQTKRGLRKLPRSLFFKKSSPPSLTASPRSERKAYLMNGNMQNYNSVPVGGSRNTTLNRMRGADAWITQLPPKNTYDEMTKTMEFEAEEENVIVADLLPDQTTTQLGTTQAHSQIQLHPTQTQLQEEPRYIRLDPGQQNGFRPVEPTQNRMRKTYAGESRTAHVQLGRASPTLQTTEFYQSADEPKPYHVRLSQTTKPGVRSRQDEIFISPLINTDDPHSAEQSAVIVLNDSDEEAGNIPTVPFQQQDDMVIF